MAIAASPSAPPGYLRGLLCARVPHSRAFSAFGAAGSTELRCSDFLDHTRGVPLPDSLDVIGIPLSGHSILRPACLKAAQLPSFLSKKFFRSSYDNDFRSLQ